MSKHPPLVEAFPEIAALWHPTKNTDLDVNTIGSRSGKKAWWVCLIGHEYQTVVGNRIKGDVAACPYCSGKKVLAGFNDFASKNPELAKQWHPTKNGGLLPSQVTAKSSKKIWWQCEKEHEWTAPPADRTNGRGCPYCYGRYVLVGENDLASQRPDVAAEWHPTKNGNLLPTDVTVRNDKKVWWQCSEGHEWKASVGNRTALHGKGTSCPVCSGNVVLPGFNDVATKNPELVALWHPSKNKLSINNVSPGSGRKVWWQCEKGHEWKAIVKSVVGGTRCPYCANLLVLPGYNDLATTHPHIAAEWHPTKNGDLLPTNIPPGVEQKVWWQCAEGHEWDMLVYARTGKLAQNCPYCSNRRIIAGMNDVKTLYPALMDEWDFDKNEMSPEEIGAGSGHRVWWKCDKGHEWKTSVFKRALAGTACPSCSFQVSRMEEEMKEYILSILPPEVEVMSSVRSIISPHELDIYIPALQIAFEFNGLYWHSEEAGKDYTYHASKHSRCAEQGIQLVMIWEDDWNLRKDVVKQMLAHKLGVSNSPKFNARSTKVEEIDADEARSFLENHHIQGFASGSIYLGLRFKESLVAVMVLTKQADDLLLSRYATSGIVRGGQSKLVRYVEKNYEYQNLITFADLEVSDGSLYSYTGFVKDKILPPDYKYVKNGVRSHKFNYRLERFRRDDALLYEEGLTESQLAKLNGLLKVWDCGKIRYVKPKPA